MAFVLTRDATGKRVSIALQARPHTVEARRLAADERDAAALVVRALGGGSLRPPLRGALLLPVSRAAPGEAAGAEPDWLAVFGRRASARVNGVAVSLGLACLRHRDEVVLADGARAFLSTETRAEVVPYPGDTDASCPRCAQPLEAGQASVCCPSCKVWQHELPDRGCWTAIERCAICEHPTDLGAGLQWLPEDW
jgi:hypothetical protein